MVALPLDVISPTIAAIDARWQGNNQRRFDRVIRGSSIGRPCERDLWFRFRWTREPEDFSGRMLRLFDTGHREEPRMIDDLRAVGVTVDEVDPATGDQWEVVALDGHFAGHLDGKARGFLEAPKAEHVCEFKTHNDKNFKQLKTHGVAVAKPEHVAQMQVYMHLTGIDRAFYLAKNKNDEELYAERVHYDITQALGLLAKAERILEATRPAPRISDDPDSFACRFCPSLGVCHGGEFGLRNCRTCLFSTPMRDGDARWHCASHDRDLSIEDQEAGCGRHLYIPDLVPGEQIDAVPNAAVVVYRLLDGSEWIDGGQSGAPALGGAT